MIDIKNTTVEIIKSDYELDLEKSDKFNHNMSLNLKDYVKIYDNFLDLNFCEEAISEIRNDEWQPHRYYDNIDDKIIKYEKEELSMLYKPNSPITETIMNKMWDVINDYLTVKHSFVWFSKWRGYTTVRYNKYDTGTKMRLHCDHIHSMFDGNRKGIPILSIIGSLNNDYEGGELIFWEKEKIELKAGQLMIFPSNFLYPHRVAEITKGTRYSYVSWAW